MASTPEAAIAKDDSTASQVHSTEKSLAGTPASDQKMERKSSYDRADLEDPATTAASETLKQATISDKEPAKQTKEPLKPAPADDLSNDGATQVPKASTPESSTAQDEEMKELIASPKKKRGREQDEDTKESGNTEEAAPSDSIANGGSRTDRSAPEKKRVRDGSEDSKAADDDSNSKTITPLNATATPKLTSEEKAFEQPSQASETSNADTKAPQTSSSAFAKSGFGALASSNTSGFGALGAGKTSVFGGGSSSLSGFGALSAAKGPSSETAAEKPSGATSGFGASFGGAKLGFGSAGQGSGFGGGFGGGFGSKPTLSSFAAAKPDIAVAEKPSKAFGAPESGAEDDEDDNEDAEDGSSSDKEDQPETEEKKKSKLPIVPVQDGEEKETTLVQFRAKLFMMESIGSGWKERGVGTLKLNVNKDCVDYNEYGVPLLGTFDLSSRDDSEEKEENSVAARLIMRQENTHKVVLNTVIIKALHFTEKAAQNSHHVAFTAFDQGKPINMLVRTSPQNAKLLTSEIASIQRELP